MSELILLYAMDTMFMVFYIVLLAWGVSKYHNFMRDRAIKTLSNTTATGAILESIQEMAKSKIFYVKEWLAWPPKERYSRSWFFNIGINVLVLALLKIFFVSSLGFSNLVVILFITDLLEYSRYLRKAGN